MAKVKIQVIYKKGDMENVGNYLPICSLPALYKIVHDNTVQQIISTARPKTSGISGGIQKLIPDSRSSCDVQND